MARVAFRGDRKGAFAPLSTGWPPGPCNYNWFKNLYISFLITVTVTILYQYKNLIQEPHDDSSIAYLNYIVTISHKTSLLVQLDSTYFKNFPGGMPPDPLGLACYALVLCDN